MRDVNAVCIRTHLWGIYLDVGYECAGTVVYRDVVSLTVDTFQPIDLKIVTVIERQCLVIMIYKIEKNN